MPPSVGDKYVYVATWLLPEINALSVDNSLVLVYAEPEPPLHNILVAIHWVACVAQVPKLPVLLVNSQMLTLYCPDAVGNVEPDTWNTNQGFKAVGELIKVAITLLLVEKSYDWVKSSMTWVVPSEAVASG